MYRVASGIAAVIFAALLIWVAVLSVGPSPVITPTVHVAPAGAKGPHTPNAAEAVLADRTRLQDEGSVASGKSTAQVLASNRLQLETGRGVQQPHSVVLGWLKRDDKNAQILRKPEYTEGISTLPYTKSNVFMQPEGRDWRRSHNGTIRYGGGWIIFGVALALALFLLGRGRVKLAEGYCGRTVLRFTSFERANHWMTASSLILLALTGLIVLYGKPLLLPLIGGNAFSSLANASAWIHMAAAVPFVIGIIVMFVIWVRENGFSRLDWEWLKSFGGFMSDSPNKPPARRFNAGQKLMFWLAVLGGVALLATGLPLMLPFYFLGYDGMQWAQLTHAAIALLMMALILGHIYIGTVGMEGAFDAMWSGRVDCNWAEEHHKLWYQRLTGQRPHTRAAPPQPAE